MSALESPRADWDAPRRHQALGLRRERLLAKLPHRIASAHGLSADVRTMVVDDAILFAATDYDGASGSQRARERVFWAASDKRVKRACEGRYDMLRAGYQRADLAALD